MRKQEQGPSAAEVQTFAARRILAYIIEQCALTLTFHTTSKMSISFTTNLSMAQAAAPAASPPAAFVSQPQDVTPFSELSNVLPNKRKSCHQAAAEPKKFISIQNFLANNYADRFCVK